MRSALRSPVVAVCALLFVAAGSCDHEEVPSGAFETSHQPIIGGSVDNGHPAVGAVLTDASLCTGTVISPRIVVTAAHCGAYGYTPKWFLLGGDVNYPDQTYYVKKWIPHPQYSEAVVDGYSLQIHDIAVMVLTDPVNVAPVKYRTSSLVGKEGTGITFVGFGQSSLYNQNSSGTKMYVASSIGSVNSQGFWNYTNPSNPKNTCQGDSGGPALMSVGGQDEVISVVSAGDPNCNKDGWNTRVDIHASWIQGIIDTYDPGGVSAECGNGYCEPGESQANCPQDCSGGSTGGLGDPCSSDGDCGSGMLCVQGPDGNFCTQYCSDPQGGGGCPSPYTCVPLTNPPPSGDGVCFDTGGSAGGCGGITYEGCCEGQTLKYCENDQLQTLSCGENPSCGWNAQAGFYDCGTGGGSDPSGSFAKTCGGNPGPVCGDGNCEGSESQSNCPADCGTAGPVCGDGKCEGTESQSNCPADCGSAGPVCGDGTCEGTESSTNCPADCATQAVCGDGKCQAPETSDSCPADCLVQTGPQCGNGTCEQGETIQSCPADCNPNNLATCGNGYCEQGETPTKCPVDCNGDNPPQCGNGYCEVGENGSSCAADCGWATCGDGTCAAPETSDSCPADCLVNSAACGDGKCEAPETSDSCPDDCVVTTGPECGDGVCEEGEVCADCPEDCEVGCLDVDGDGRSDASCSAGGRPAAGGLVLLGLALVLLVGVRREESNE